ncbi:MAG: hypothetical protein Q8N81_00005, partial [bacterium]|nr:hypothetical protein [bacterium]
MLTWRDPVDSISCQVLDGLDKEEGGLVIYKHEVLTVIKKLGLVLVFYTPDLEKAKQVAVAYYKGGGRALEYTNRGPGAWLVFAELASWCAENLPGLILGVGSVIDVE